MDPNNEQPTPAPVTPPEAPEPAAPTPPVEEPTPAPEAPVPAPFAAPAQPAPQAALPDGIDPGKTLAIIGLVLDFVVTIAGIIVSAIALSQSKKAGHNNKIAKVGLILGIVLFVLGIIIGIVLVSTMPTTTTL